MQNIADELPAVAGLPDVMQQAYSLNEYGKLPDSSTSWKRFHHLIQPRPQMTLERQPDSLHEHY